MPVKYVHTNLIAKDWKQLSSFYQEVLECVPVPPERDLSGQWLDKALSTENAHISGIHLRLPGCGGNGPTLEIFQYDSMLESATAMPNTPGFSHIAFTVDDVAAKAQEIFNAGGIPVGELTIREIPGVGTITFQYVRDPEGNIIELQGKKNSSY